MLLPAAADDCEHVHHMENRTIAPARHRGRKARIIADAPVLSMHRPPRLMSQFELIGKLSYDGLGEGLRDSLLRKRHI
jgi:hypothetical protein